MEYIAAFDLGTTAIKGVLLSREGDIYKEHTVNLHTTYGENNEMEQNPEEWWAGIQAITHEWFTVHAIAPEAIKAITFSGQMEDVILIHEGDNTTRAILYSDNRAHEEALRINRELPELNKLIGNAVSPSSPISKLVWLNKHEMEHLSENVHVVFSAKDYIIYKLTDAIVTDYVTGATTGLMNIKTRTWMPDLLKSLQIENFILPSLLPPEVEVGKVSLKGASRTGFHIDTPVLCGAGDAGASTLGAGAISEGDCYMYLGTTGWIAVSSKDSSPKDSGIFTLAHVVPDLNISIAPLLNIGNVHRWAMETFVEADNYAAFEEEVLKSAPGSNHLLFLPYLHGERCPIQDSEAKGAFWGIGPETKKSDLVRAVLEGICFSLFQITQMLVQKEIGMITLIGGGAKSASWCQTLADITNKTVRVPANSEYLPSIGIGSTAFAYLGWIENSTEFIEEYIKSSVSKTYYPTEETKDIYATLYETFVKLYPAMVGVYR
ncbi:FGGY family carbohydrate kinase [Neobacillus sp. FSL H8-0543]|uniref:xylulokinase n=1 Tax=Neobacillus sp. FSL H8-0543 TaxID=2954672 RepID=UPI00315927A0